MKMLMLNDYEYQLLEKIFELVLDILKKAIRYAEMFGVSDKVELYKNLLEEIEKFRRSIFEK